MASKVAGRVIARDSPDYELSRLVFNRAFDKRPALIVRCANTDDVARTLEFAQGQTVPIAVRVGGHNRAGLSVCDGGVVIDLSVMNQVTVDADKRVARAQGGALTVHFDNATQRFGLATTLAGCPTVGVSGLTLGGGLGLLLSMYGAACDNLISAQLVTADGRLVEASNNSNPDLFWAIRGGGGNFGVATALDFRLHPVGNVLSGRLIYPPGRVPELLEAFARHVASEPNEMRVSAYLAPPERGPRFRMSVCHLGDPHEGNELLSPMRALEPQEDTIRVRSYLETQATLFPAAPIAHFQTALVLPELGKTAIQTLVAAAYVRDSTASASTTSGECASAGRRRGQRISRLSTITEVREMGFKNGMRPVHPGEVLREDYLKPLEMSVNALAKQLGIPTSRLNDIVLKRRGVTPDTAMRLARYFGGDARSWLNLQTAHDLRVTEIQKAREIERMVHPLRKSASPSSRRGCRQDG
jgi:addiction module HigA family antidote